MKMTISSQHARFIADSIIRDAPIRLTQAEWNTFRKFVINRLENVTISEFTTEIDSSKDY